MRFLRFKAVQLFACGVGLVVLMSACSSSESEAEAPTATVQPSTPSATADTEEESDASSGGADESEEPAPPLETATSTPNPTVTDEPSESSPYDFDDVVNVYCDDTPGSVLYSFFILDDGDLPGAISDEMVETYVDSCPELIGCLQLAIPNDVDLTDRDTAYDYLLAASERADQGQAAAACLFPILASWPWADFVAHALRVSFANCEDESIFEFEFGTEDGCERLLECLEDVASEAFDGFFSDASNRYEIKAADLWIYDGDPFGRVFLEIMAGITPCLEELLPSRA